MDDENNNNNKQFKKITNAFKSKKNDFNYVDTNLNKIINNKSSNNQSNSVDDKENYLNGIKKDDKKNNKKNGKKIKGSESNISNDSIDTDISTVNAFKVGKSKKRNNSSLNNNNNLRSSVAKKNINNDKEKGHKKIGRYYVKESRIKAPRDLIEEIKRNKNFMQQQVFGKEILY